MGRACSRTLSELGRPPRVFVYAGWFHRLVRPHTWQSRDGVYHADAGSPEMSGRRWAAATLRCCIGCIHFWSCFFASSVRSDQPRLPRNVASRKYWRDGVLECCASEFITPLPHNSISFSVWIFADRGVGLKRGEKPFTQGDGIRVAA